MSKVHNTKKYFGTKILKRSLINKFTKTRAFDCQSDYLIIIYLSKTADWQSKARVLINLSIRERFRIFIMNPGRAFSIFNTSEQF